MYRGKYYVENFIEYIEEEVSRLYATFPQQPMTRLTDGSKREHEAAEKCHICLKQFNDPKNKKVRDHCHHTADYRGPAHNNCYLKYRISDDIVLCFITYVVMTLVYSFNVKINVKLVGVKDNDGRKVYKNIQLGFIDSFRFMTSSLDKEASNLCGTSGIHCNKCKGNMELINISGDYIASLGCEK